MLLDFSKNILLNKKQEKTYRFLRIGLLVLFIIASLLFFLELLFPTSKFSLSGDFRYRIEKPSLTEDKKTTFSIVPPREVDSLKLKLKLNKNSKPKKKIEIDLYKSYGAFLYEITTDNETKIEQKNKKNPPLAENSLIASKDSVYITHQNKKYPFDSVETLLLSGYSFDDILNPTDKQLSFYQKGNLFKLSDYHLPGTVFFATDSKKYFEVLENKKLKEIPKNNSKNIIKVNEKSRTIHSTCVLNKKLLPLNTYSCIFDLKNIISFSGKRFTFYTDDLEPQDIDSIETIFYTKKSKDNLKKRLSQLKNLLLNRNN